MTFSLRCSARLAYTQVSLFANSLVFKMCRKITTYILTEFVDFFNYNSMILLKRLVRDRIVVNMCQLCDIAVPANSNAHLIYHPNGQVVKL